ncbi:(p)ppGpp synthetase I, SpoT/RelA [Ammonifex degensii KC4]|uniref:GTP diphosphokinase n=1 Tax=Ammonifex degensii (strain DSM 10501 / KC4) TaxID=429009 RepID=C9RBA6_AMMDK|nr:bifunctional (p)ppGpp synthetase/guanosine-3',5'-bis(diphosphate) 3'-pyrophosphohydrolase [Ammonifex degensii]ACX51533.1 (p)ppGpp synthetase I, SpoT/RelA [Ammonifex degensii KC4]
MELYEELLAQVKAYNPGVNEALLRKAFDFAQAKHAGQRRFSGEPFLSHPVAVARILAELELDTETIVAGLLHDVVEDTGTTLEEIEHEFGAEIAALVDGVTKLSRLQFRSQEEQQAENLRKMFVAMAKDVRVVLIKLADRLHNLRTLQYLPPEKQRAIAKETLEIFAPLAHRLGIYRLKWELEDLAFRYLEPERYRELAAKVAKTRAAREEYTRELIAILQKRLEEAGIKAELMGRPKNLYSIYQKMLRDGKEYSEIYDRTGIRALVETVRDCYAVLGVVHTLWKPVPGRFKDYIAMPKENMYQSLHTTVIGPQGEPVEVQIRTYEMHRTAEYGIAAHWRYKEGQTRDKQLEAKFAWLRELLEWVQEMRDAREFMERLKIDVFSDVVFVFTPKGDVVELPAGAVPLDFAYRIHTEVGHRYKGAKVNGRLVPLDYQLKTGDIVEIITGPKPNPSRDWLNVVRTSQARSRIRQWFKREFREEAKALGRELLEKEARRLGLPLEELKEEKLLEQARRFNLQTVEDLYVALAQGAVTPSSILRADLKEKEKATPPAENRAKRRSNGHCPGVRVVGADNVLVRLAHCCHPIPGDPIIGYITRGRGISVHHRDCRNVAVWQEREKERLVEVFWEEGVETPFDVRLEISAVDRAGLLGDVMEVLADMKISASWVEARGNRRMATIEFTARVRNKEQLDYLMRKISRVKDVFEVRRVV